MTGSSSTAVRRVAVLAGALGIAAVATAGLAMGPAGAATPATQPVPTTATHPAPTTTTLPVANTTAHPVPTTTTHPVPPTTTHPVPVAVTHAIGLAVHSTVAGTPLAGATYRLCRTPIPTAGPATTPGAGATAPAPAKAAPTGCPTGTVVAASATMGAAGTASFPGRFPAGTYYVVESVAPKGYDLDLTAHKVVIAAGSSSAPAELALVNRPDVPPPTAHADAATTAEGHAVIVRVLANDKGHSAPLVITAVTDPNHGTARVIPAPSCHKKVCREVIRYTPAAGFAGTDTFRYTVTTRGGSATALVTIRVTAPPQTLAFTGTPTGSLLATGLGLVGLGSVLTLAATRFRREH